MDKEAVRLIKKEIKVVIQGQEVSIEGLPEDCNLTITVVDTGFGYNFKNSAIHHIDVPDHYSGCYCDSVCE